MSGWTNVAKETTYDLDFQNAAIEIETNNEPRLDVSFLDVVVSMSTNLCAS